VKLPLLLINFKSYSEALGRRGLKLAQICDRVSKKYNVSIAVAPQYVDIREIVSATDVPVFAQHIDPIEEAGAFTGHLVAKNLKEVGIAGTLINHSERKLGVREIGKCIEITKRNKLISVCCAASNREAKKIAGFKPDFIAIEPPELIGGDISVSVAKPEIVERGVRAVKGISPRTEVLCGAGVKTEEDVRKAILLGTVGVLVASGVVKASNKRAVIEEMVRGLLKYKAKRGVT
jgi:triosephosphate isomerase